LKRGHQTGKDSVARERVKKKGEILPDSNRGEKRREVVKVNARSTKERSKFLGRKRARIKRCEGLEREKNVRPTCG